MDVPEQFNASMIENKRVEREIKSLSKHMRETFFIFLFGMLSTFIFCPKCLNYFPHNWPDLVFTGVLWVVLWKGNEWLAIYPDRYISWREFPTRRLLIGICLHIVYTLLASFAVEQLANLILNGEFRWRSFDEILSYNLTAVIIAIIISLFLTARTFVYFWRDLAIEHEQLKAESMASRFASLKAQMNPHFLFNSLNVLSGLVYKDPDLSAQFIRKLAEVYRYVLDRQDKEVVSIEEELEFINSIIFLQRIRFGEHLKINITIHPNSSYKIAPMALQMLVENAIKHNVISADQPLNVEIGQNGHHFFVKNSLQKKQVMSGSLGIGLNNIKKRYEFLTDRPVIIDQQEDAFIVKLPILKDS